ncbi:hypothetical protein HCY52_15060 [Acinetobacter radioresistens]|uniref:hypothetical protein n=1 Tax=Acinetobacter radioresistens TaxID=40216 RepID=UPI002005B57B|nr:hypothetical protein [Acinetobacter radioresistens]MCK4085132.1 hypothetical protein [Acinetobacter radioresistens]
MFILDLKTTTNLFTPEQIEAINIYALIRSLSSEDYAKESVHEFNVNLNGLRLSEFMLHDFAQPEDLDLDQIMDIISKKIDFYEADRVKELADTGELGHDFSVTDRLLYLALIEFSEYIKDEADDDHLAIINRLHQLIETQ